MWAVGEAAVVVLVSVFSQSYLFTSKTKNCGTLEKHVWLPSSKSFIGDGSGGSGSGSRGDYFLLLFFIFYYSNGARAWRRQTPWYVPCGEAVCVVCHDLAVTM